MSYKINDLILPRPVRLVRKQIESGATVTTLTGATKKDITNRKEQYILHFQALTQTEVANILTEYNKEDTVDFESTEANLAIPSTECQMDITQREYNTKGSEYREDLIIILTEVV